MKQRHFSFNRVLCGLGVTGSVSLACILAQADTLESKDGKVLNGKYVGGTASTVRFETSAGVQTIETSQVLALTFSGGGAAAGAAAAPPAAPAGTTAAAPAGAASANVTVNAGTPLLVRLVDPVTSKDPQGKRFTTTLETDLVVNGKVVAKAGTKVYGRVQDANQAGRYAGQSTLALGLSEMAIGPSLVPIVTGGYTQSGEKSIRKTARGAAAGAAIGAIADGGDGAGKGAAIGAVASGVKKGQGIAINPGTLLEFKLQQPLTVNITG